jgi:FecR protein
MPTAPKTIWRTLLILSLLTLTASQIFAATPAQTLNLPDGGIIEDETDPEVQARVARVSFLRGEAKIRHADSDEWETVTLNLPVVEGDEIVTDKDARLEIQFDNYKHLRLSENAYLKIANLKYEGIAVSISLGTMTLRLTAFDKDKAYFEIDAPKTTLAIQRSGTYRVDAGKDGDHEIRTTITNGGEARIYSDNAGFTLKNGRSARIYIDGPTVGEWETAEASRFEDEFDTWALDRDDTIAKRIKDAYYDKYYDQDIYGADDLNDYGDWVYRSGYGYVWRPYRASIVRYADWSPYRYGHWRWIPPYGWTWVNDEPWGWATYHHGRWFYDAGYWYWSPYGYYRARRSWWFPALVVINIFNNNVCWYPLGYRYRYHNYNGWYHRRRNQGGYSNNNNNHAANNPPPTGGVKPIPTTRNEPVTGGTKAIPLDETRAGSVKKGEVPPSGVVTVRTDEFGTKKTGIRTAPPAIATTALAATPRDDNPPVLPAYSAIKVSPDIVTTRPKMDVTKQQASIGAAPRKTAPLDDELRTTRIFNGRPPVVNNNSDTGGMKSIPGSTAEPTREPSREPRKTGAVERPPVVVKQQSDDQPPVRTAPSYTPPTRSPDKTRQSEPVKTPSYEPPRETTRTQRSEQPPVKQAPPPRSDPPTTRSEPTKQAPPKSDPPPSKSEPPKSDTPTKKRDGR